MEDIKIVELPEKSSIDVTNHLIVEDEDGTKKVYVKHFRSLLISSLYFNNIEELKNSTSASLKEGDICETLGYYTPGDGGGAKYRITYNPGAVEDGGLVHYLSYSDTLRAEIILSDNINVHQFGAKGDGVTDDTYSIQLAIDNCNNRTIEFINYKKYIVRSPIKINKNSIIINGNGAALCPYYVNGINITPENDGEIVNDITINKLYLDCEKAVNGIYVFKASKVDINSCKFSNVTNTGIDIRNSEFVNINYSDFTGNNTSSLISIDGDNATSDDVYNRFINITDCNFNNFYKAINILSAGTTGDINATINVDNCNYLSTANNSCCIYVACPVEIVTIYSNTVMSVDTFLYFGGISKGDISCRGISCINTNKVFDIGTTQGVLHLDGSIKTSPSSILFENMNGKLRSNVSWDLLSNGALFNNKPNGDIYDSIHPYNYTEGRGYSISNSKLVIRECRNLHVDWTSSTNNINEIQNGIKGQLLYIKSTTSKNIISVPNKIILSDSAIKLGPYRGILMRYDGSKWVQIQYEDSTILQTVSEDLDIDYSRISFDTSEIIPAEK